MNSNKSRIVKLRLSPEIYESWKQGAQSYPNLSSYIRDAVESYKGVSASSRYATLNEERERYISTQKHLGHMGANLNQAMKYGNELVKIGVFNKSYFENNLFPIIRDTYDAVISLMGEVKRLRKLIEQKQ